mmetsp:Transcript_36171/g.53963  ORF Transcript_36171/g.53963 Transcript_36171/m.53963 type:complete len:293 (+) Transcript_36171:2178-3056(+)
MTGIAYRNHNGTSGLKNMDTVCRLSSASLASSVRCSFERTITFSSGKRRSHLRLRRLTTHFTETMTMMTAKMTPEIAANNVSRNTTLSLLPPTASKSSYSAFTKDGSYCGECGHFLAALLMKRSISVCRKFPSISFTPYPRSVFATLFTSPWARSVVSSFSSSFIRGLVHETQVMFRLISSIEISRFSNAAEIADDAMRIPRASRVGAGRVAIQQSRFCISRRGNSMKGFSAIFMKASSRTLAVLRSMLTSISFLRFIPSSLLIPISSLTENVSGRSSTPKDAILFKLYGNP